MSVLQRGHGPTGLLWKFRQLLLRFAQTLGVLVGLLLEEIKLSCRPVYRHVLFEIESR